MSHSDHIKILKNISCVSEYTFREKESHEVVDETIFLIFAELDRFDKELEECVSMADKWFYSLKHVGRMERLPEEKLKYEHDMMTELTGLSEEEIRQS